MELPGLQLKTEPVAANCISPLAFFTKARTPEGGNKIGANIDIIIRVWSFGIQRSILCFKTMQLIKDKYFIMRKFLINYLVTVCVL